MWKTFAYNWELIFLQWDATIWVGFAMHFRNSWKKKKKRLSQILITPFSSRISVQNFFYTIITTHYDTHYNFPLFKKYIPWKLNYFKELKFNNDQSVTTHKFFFFKAKQKIKYMHGKYFDQFLEKKKLTSMTIFT